MKQANTYVIRIEEDKARATTWIKNLDMGLGPWDVKVTKHRKTRALAQNRYYWGVVIALLVEYSGSKADDIHEYLLMECFGTEEYEVFDKRRVRPVRTTTHPKKMTVDEFEAYMEWCRGWAARRGVIIPEPNEVDH